MKKIFIIFFIFCINALADDSIHDITPARKSDEKPIAYIRKIAVFPMEAPRSLAKPAEDSWWKVRETLTDTKRFLVASKKFLIQKDVYQSRSKLNPSDAILLSQLLEADVLFTMSINNKELSMTAYSHFDGSKLWQGFLNLHPSLPAEKQLEEVSVKLIRDFIAAIPYHGLQIQDPLIGKPIFEEGDIRLAKIDVGSNSRAVEGDVVQWVQIDKMTTAPLFSGGGQMEIYAEGEVIKNENGILLVELKRVKDLSKLTTNSLIRLPKEADFLNSNYALSGTRALTPELRYSPLPPATPVSAETKPLVTALVSIANFAALLLLAF